MHVLILISLVVVSCVSKHRDYEAKQTGDNVDSELVVSVEKNDRLSTKNFWVMEYSLENKGSDYKRFDRIDIAVDRAIEKQVKVVVGQDLVNWSEGIKNKIERDNYNFNVFMAGLTAVAAGAAATSKDPNVQKVGLSVAAAGAGTIAINEFVNIRNNVKDSTKYDLRGLIPDNHILSAPVSLPPNLFLKRFAVFYIPKKLNATFYKFDMKFHKEKKGGVLAMQAKFAPATALPGAKCPPDSKVMTFRKRKIHCLSECQIVHPLNRKNCEQTYRRKYMN